MESHEIVARQDSRDASKKPFTFQIVQEKRPLAIPAKNVEKAEFKMTCSWIYIKNFFLYAVTQRSEATPPYADTLKAALLSCKYASKETTSILVATWTGSRVFKKCSSKSIKK